MRRRSGSYPAGQRGPRKDGEHPNTAAAAWLKEHPDVVEGWLEGVTTFEGEPGPPAVEEHLGIS